MTIKVFSMFDGVGGFPVGLNKSDSTFFKTLYSNQFEPSRKSQDAFEVGVYKFPETIHLNDDITTVPDSKFQEMKDAGVNMIVAGFPCQDYSVARSKKGELGIEGKKGVLFWEIIRATKVIKPDYLILENVDRLLKAPSKQRGRDFAVMLATFNSLGYNVEWRVINAADYGMVQRRRRVFFFITKNNSAWSKHLDSFSMEDVIFKEGLFAKQFKVKPESKPNRNYSDSLFDDIAVISEKFCATFWNSGYMKNGKYCTLDSIPEETRIKPLSEILEIHSKVDNKYFLDEAKIEKFKYLRGAKKVERTALNGHKYLYSEGSMSEYDDVSLPARTMLTSEGTVNRSTHIIKVDNKNVRLLTPREAEQLQGFEVDWTRYKQLASGDIVEVPDRLRYFFMGNALVTDIVTRIGNEIKSIQIAYKK